jgi:hypothetical protein
VTDASGDATQAGEHSNAVGVGGNEQNDALVSAGAVYVFARDGLDEWSQQAHVKASNTGDAEVFGIAPRHDEFLFERDGSTRTSEKDMDEGLAARSKRTTHILIASTRR